MLMSLLLAAGVSALLQTPTLEPEPTTHRLRSLDPSIRATIEEGCQRSPWFAELVELIERSTYFVYVEQVPALHNRKRGALLHGGAGPRYLRVHLERGMPTYLRLAVLAHELQHVREVVEAGIPAVATEMDALFRRIGDQRLAGGARQQYETAAALRVAEAVAKDLRANRPAGRSGRSCQRSASATYSGC